MNFLTPLVLLIIGGALAKRYVLKESVLPRRTSNEERLANLRSQMQTAFQEGDTAKYLELQREIELLELEL